MFKKTKILGTDNTVTHDHPTFLEPSDTLMEASSTLIHLMELSDALMEGSFEVPLERAGAEQSPWLVTLEGTAGAS